jgi:hypothetical protein
MGSGISNSSQQWTSNVLACRGSVGASQRPRHQVGPTNPVLFCGSLCRPKQIEVTDTERDRYFVHGDYRGIAAAALKTADVLLAEA